MIVQINGTEYELHFGIKFVRELDKAHHIDHEGLQFGAGVEMLYPLLVNGNPTALSEIIWTATNTEKARPTLQQIDEYLESLDDLDSLISEVSSELKNGKMTRKQVQKIEANMGIAQ